MKNRKKLINLLLVVLWMGVIFWFSGHNAAESSQQSGAVLRQMHEYGATSLTQHEIRKAAHFGLYLVLGMLLYGLLRHYKASSVKKQLWLAVLAAALYACTDELHQLFISGRSSELRDVAVDTIGAAIGIGIYYIALTHLQALNKPGPKEPTKHIVDQ